MWNQKDLFGDVLPTPETNEDLKEVCCESCYTAQEQTCTCKCHGAYHGLGNHNKAKIDSSYEKELPEDEAEEFRKLYGKAHSRGPNTTKCLCGTELKDEPILYYVPHESGWTIEGEAEKVWLYVKCPKCGYDMAIWKMGVPRE